MDAEPLGVRFTKLDPIAPNSLYGPHPAFRYQVEVRGADGSRPADDSLLERLAEFVPEIREIRSCGQPGPVRLAHVIEHLCIELQQRAGTRFACTRAAGCADGRALAILPFENEDLLERALEWVAAALENADDVDVQAEFDSFIGYVGRKMLPAQDRRLIASAKERDVPMWHMAGRTFILGQGCYQRRISATKTSLTNSISNDLAANKDYSRRILQERGLPVPEYARVYSRRAALRAAERIGFPVVMKPVFGNMGRGVVVGVSNAKEVRAAYKHAREFGRAVLVEELVPGDDYRFLVVGGKLVAVAKRMPGHVVGDGRRNIGELVELANQDPRRGHDHNAPMTRLEIDEQAEQLLARNDYTVDSVPKSDEIVFLRRNANLSTGGVAIDMTDQVHPETREVAERAARAIGLDIAGVDLLTTDISRSLFDTGGKICEINSRPGIRKHIWPMEGQSRDVTGPIVDMLFPHRSNGRVPVVAVVGSGPADLTARMLAEALDAAGRHVGVGRGGRVYIRGTAQRHKHRLTPPELIRGVVLDPDVDVAVVQFDADEAAECGLDCDAFDMTLVVGAGSEANRNGDPTSRTGLDLMIASTRDLVVIDETDLGAQRLEERWSGHVEFDGVQGLDPEPNQAESPGQRAAAFADRAAVRMGIPKPGRPHEDQEETVSMDHARIELDPRVMSATEDVEPNMESLAAEAQQALREYPHFCVVKLPAEVDDRKTFIALAAAIAGEDDPNAAKGSDKKRLSFTNVRIDEANANAPRKTGTRYSRTNLPMAPHTDSSFRGTPHELVAFHCVTHDEAGGESVLAAVEDILRQLDPTVVSRLREPVYPFGKHLRPVISGDPGREEIRYYRAQLDRPLNEGAAELSAEHLAAIDALDVVLDRSERYHQIHLLSGEILFMQNRKVLHGRTGFEGESKRHFRRIRLNASVLGNTAARYQ